MAVVFDEVVGTVESEPSPSADVAPPAAALSKVDEAALLEELRRIEERQRRLRAD